jgi:hypothetical protein
VKAACSCAPRSPSAQRLCAGHGCLFSPGRTVWCVSGWYLGNGRHLRVTRLPALLLPPSFNSLPALAAISCMVLSHSLRALLRFAMTHGYPTGLSSPVTPSFRRPLCFN